MKTDSKRSIPAPGRRKRHFYLPTTTAVALLALLPFAGCKKGGAAAGAGAPGGMPPQEVGFIVVKPQRTEIVSELPGRTAAFRVAEVRPQVSGIVLRRQFTEGAEVDENEQLYQIDPATYRATYDSAQAAVDRAEAARVLAKLNADRQKRLFDTHVASKEEYDTTFASLKQAEADLASAKASLETARISLVYTKVLSPISGIIGRSAVTEGALVTSGQATALSTVQQLDPIYVDVTQSSAQLLRLQRELGNGQLANAGQQEASAKLILEDGTEYSETGKLQFSEVTVDQGTGSVTLRAVFPNPRRELLPGHVRPGAREGRRE